MNRSFHSKTIRNIRVWMSISSFEFPLLEERNIINFWGEREREGERDPSPPPLSLSLTGLIKSDGDATGWRGFRSGDIGCRRLRTSIYHRGCFPRLNWRRPLFPSRVKQVNLFMHLSVFFPMPLSRAQLAIERSESSSSSHIVRIHVYIYARLYIWNPRRQRVCRRLYYVTHDNDWTKRWIPFDTRYRLFHIFSNERVWNWTCSAHFFRPTPKRAQHRYSHVPAGKQRYRGGPACATYIYMSLCGADRFEVKLEVSTVNEEQHLFFLRIRATVFW